MAYKDPGKEIQRRVTSLAVTVNAALSAHYRTNKAKVNDQLSVSVSANKAGVARTPEQQAKEVLEGQSRAAGSIAPRPALRFVDRPLLRRR